MSVAMVTAALLILIEGSLVAFYENKNTGNCGQIVYSRTRFCNVTRCKII